MLWPPYAKDWLLGKDPDAGKDWRQGGEGDDRGWDVSMASLTRQTYIWASSRCWWWTGKPGMLQSMELQRVGHGWVTELKCVMVENPLASPGDTVDTGSIPGLGISPIVGNGNPFQYSCQEYSMDRGSWWITVLGGHNESDTTEQLSMSMNRSSINIYGLIWWCAFLCFLKSSQYQEIYWTVPLM